MEGKLRPLKASVKPPKDDWDWGAVKFPKEADRSCCDTAGWGFGAVA